MLHLDGAQLDGNVIKATFVLVANKRRREPSPGVSLVSWSALLHFHVSLQLEALY
jgi:hypothetical protein